MAKVKIQLNHAGMDALLKSQGVGKMLHDKAEEVKARADAAKPHHESGEITYYVHDEMGRSRRMSVVVARHVMGAYLERKHRTLGRALRSLRGG